MSSNPPTEALPRSGRFAGWSLRVRLITAMVALFAIVCAIIGLTSYFLLSTFQVQQLDNQLQQAADRTINAWGPRQPPPGSAVVPNSGGPPGGSLGPTGQPGSESHRPPQ